MGHNFLADNADVGVFSGLDMVIAGIEWAGHDENNVQSLTLRVLKKIDYPFIFAWGTLIMVGSSTSVQP